MEESALQSRCNNADVKPALILALCFNLGKAISYTSTADAPPWAPNATYLEHGEIFKSSTQAFDAPLAAFLLVCVKDVS